MKADCFSLLGYSNLALGPRAFASIEGKISKQHLFSGWHYKLLIVVNSKVDLAQLLSSIGNFTRY